MHQITQREFIAHEPADMHCHLDFADNWTDIAKLAAEHGRSMLSATVDPRDFERVFQTMSPYPNVQVAAGLHPWWISNGTCGTHEIELLESLVKKTSFIGEIGLDFAKRHEGTEQTQIAAFDHVVAACTKVGGKVLTIHSLRSADTVLDILERHNATDSCACILHWFSGSNEQLHRAIRLGCWFSINDRMTSSGRGKEYAKVIPTERLLLETDLPSRPHEPCSYQMMNDTLESCLKTIEQVRREPCRNSVIENSRQLLAQFSSNL